MITGFEGLDTTSFNRFTFLEDFFGSSFPSFTFGFFRFLRFSRLSRSRWLVRVVRGAGAGSDFAGFAGFGLKEERKLLEKLGEVKR